MLALLLAATLHQAPPPRPAPTLAMAMGRRESCDGVKRAKHGWLGLVKGAKGWALVPLTSRPSDGGDAGNSVCAAEDTHQNLALRGGGLGPRAVQVAALEGDSECRIAPTTAQLAAEWSVEVHPDGVLRLSSGPRVVDYALGNTCWTSLVVGDLDADGTPDVLATRTSNGTSVVLGLSGQGGGKSPIPASATLEGPGC